tara:strand:- start:886 stop:1686 length:801 start_codon:yes stop_codon:yes gene_type:complete
MPAESTYVKEFLDRVGSARDRDTSRGYWAKYDDEKIIAYVKNLSKYKFRKLISDNFWNYYPTYSYDRVTSRRSHGNAIHQLVKYLCDYCPDLRSELLNRSEGLLLAFVLDCNSGKLRIKAAKRAVSSKDVRVRRRAAGILPTRYLKIMLSDRNGSVRSKAVNRIGIDNCADALLEDSQHWLRRHALAASDITTECAKGKIDSIVTDAQKYGYNKWHVEGELAILLKKISYDDLLYYLNVADEIGSEKIRTHISCLVENVAQNLERE